VSGVEPITAARHASVLIDIGTPTIVPPTPRDAYCLWLADDVSIDLCCESHSNQSILFLTWPKNSYFKDHRGQEQLKGKTDGISAF